MNIISVTKYTNEFDVLSIGSLLPLLLPRLALCFFPFLFFLYLHPDCFFHSRTSSSKIRPPFSRRLLWSCTSVAIVLRRRDNVDTPSSVHRPSLPVPTKSETARRPRCHRRRRLLRRRDWRRMRYNRRRVWWRRSRRWRWRFPRRSNGRRETDWRSNGSESTSRNVSSSSWQLRCQQRNEWMNKWMNEWMDEWMDAWMNEWMNEWISKWMHEWINEWMEE